MSRIIDSSWRGFTSPRRDITLIVFSLLVTALLVAWWVFFFPSKGPYSVEVDKFVLLVSLFVIILVFTLFMSSMAALLIQLFGIAVLLWLDVAPLPVEFFIITVIIVIAYFLHRMKLRILALLNERDGKEKELQKALSELQKVDALKDEVIFIASHDLRTPLSIVKSNLSSILDGYAGKVNKQARSYIEAAYRASDRLGHLLEDLLEASVADHQEMVDPAPVQMEEVIAIVVRNHKKEFSTLQVSIPKPPYRTKPVFVDKLMLQRALENLILNAMKYTKRGSVTVTVEQGPGVVRCSIADTGIGIAADAQERLFTKFYRAPNAVNVQTRGSGLGLYITKQIIQRLRGRISMQSEEGKGSTFTIELPEAQDGKVK
jgi:signal transduction histidine kinase